MAGSGGVAALAGRLAEEKLPSRLAGQELTLPGPLAWTTLHKSARSLIGEVATLRAALHADGLDRIVLAGSSRAPEVITDAAGFALTVLDSPDPGQVADALAGDLDRTVLVISGSTLQNDSIRRVFTAAFAAEGIDPATRMIVITEPGAPLASLDCRRVFLTDQAVADGFSVLGAHGLVPAGLAGADIAALLDEAAAAFAILSADTPDNPALWLGAALAGAEKAVLADSAFPGFAEWAGQLIARTAGLAPVVVESPAAPNFADAGPRTVGVCIGPAGNGSTSVTDGPLGGLFLLWQFSAAIAGTILGVSPVDQPDAAAADIAARSILAKPVVPDAESSIMDGMIEIHASAGLLPDGVDSVAGALRALLAEVPEHGYVAVRAHLDRLDDASAVVLRSELARRSGTQTTFGWGAHSTGNADNGVFLQITGTPDNDLEVPDQQYTLGALQLAQALGDGHALAELGRPVLRLHLTDRAAGLVALVHALAEVSP
jgi:glucose-6-phosphate isomerase